MEFSNNGPVDLTYLNDTYKKELEDIFSKVTKPTVAIWDVKVKRSVYSIYSKESLEKAKISNVLIDDITTLEKTNKYKSLIFFIKSSIKMIDLVESVIKRNLCDEYHLIFVPSILTCHEEYIRKKNLETKFKSTGKFKCYGIPLENDLISLENPDFIMNMNHLTTLYDLAKTIMLIQSLYGTIPSVSGQGEKFQELMKILTVMKKSSPEQKSIKQSKIHQMLIFDRRIDMLTPLLCQITYEGLLDELFKFSSGFICVPVVFLNKSGSMDDTELFQMNSSDVFYAEVRDAVIQDYMKKIVNFHHEVEAEREKYLKARKLEEMAEVTSNLKAFKSREKAAHFHFSMAMYLNKYTKRSDYADFVTAQNNFISQKDCDKIHPIVEEYLIKNKEDIGRIIQLICIQSLCSNGLKPKLLNSYKREILRTYGLSYAAVLMRLEKMGLLTCQQTSSMIPLGEKAFETLVTTLDLVPESQNMSTDVSNIYAGFVPIITRLVQYFFKPGWPSISRALNLLPGAEAPSSAPATSTDSHSVQNTDRKVVLVVYIGGATFSEISTLRFLSQQEDSNTSYIILTTGIITNVTYLESLAQPYELPKSTNPFNN